MTKFRFWLITLEFLSQIVVIVKDILTKKQNQTHGSESK